jgi:hypothetical protein
MNITSRSIHSSSMENTGNFPRIEIHRYRRILNLNIRPSDSLSSPMGSMRRGIRSATPTAITASFATPTMIGAGASRLTDSCAGSCGRCAHAGPASAHGLAGRGAQTTPHWSVSSVLKAVPVRWCARRQSKRVREDRRWLAALFLRRYPPPVGASAESHSLVAYITDLSVLLVVLVITFTCAATHAIGVLFLTRLTGGLQALCRSRNPSGVLTQIAD